MFSRTNGASPTENQPITPMNALLDKPDCSIREILDNTYTVQEVKFQNKRLLEFLAKPENLVSLAEICVTEPSGDDNDRKKYRQCHTACEIFCVANFELTTALANSSECLRIFFSVLGENSTTSEDESPAKSVNPLLASFFMKIFNVLVSNQMEKVLEYMQNKPEVLETLIANIDTAAISDCLHRFAVGNGSTDVPTNKVKSWLIERRFISKVIAMLDVNHSEEMHENASNLLSDLVRTLREAQYGREEKTADLILDELQSASTLNDLLDRIFPKTDATSTDSIVMNGCTVLFAYLQTVYVPYHPLEAASNLGKVEQQQSNSLIVIDRISNEMEIWTPDPDRTVEKALVGHMEGIKRYLLKERTQEPILLPMGTVQSPFGAPRLITTKLLAQMLTNGLPEIHQEFVRLDLFKVLTELFFAHPWNNFLHTNVVNVAACALFSRLPYLVTSNSADVPTTNGDVTELEKVEEPCKPANTSEVPATNGDVAGIAKEEPSKPSFPSPLLKQLYETGCLETIVQKCQQSAGSDEAGSKRQPYVGHLMRMAMYFYHAGQQGPHQTTMVELFDGLPEDEKARWNQFSEAILVPYIKQNEPDLVAPFPPLDGDTGSERLEEMATALERASAAFVEFNNRCKASSEVPDDHGHAADAFTMDNDDPVHKLMAKAADIDVKMNPIPEPAGEASFEEMCSKRINLCGNGGEQEENDEEDDELMGKDDEDGDEWVENGTTVEAPLTNGGGGESAVA